MKTFFRLSILYLLIISGTHSSCDKSTDNPDDPVVSDSLTVFLSGGSLTDTLFVSFKNSKDAVLIVVKSDQPWTAHTNSLWLSMAAYSGDAGSTGVLAGVSPNSSMPRKGTLTFTTGEKSYPIAIRQKGAPKISFTIDNTSFNMIHVEGGKFTLGDNNMFGSQPAYEVQLGSYYIGETEVTNGLWYSVMKSLPYDQLGDIYAGHTEHDRINHPVSAVTWAQVTSDFLPAISSALGNTFRLPTEAEWEYAALGGIHAPLSGHFIYSGSNDLDKVGWYDWNSGNDKKEVGLKLPNQLGIYDMSGNVSEWCSDWFTNYYNTEDQENPKGSSTGSERVVRGGNYSSSVQFTVGECAVKYRSYLVPGCVNGCWGDTGHPDEPLCFRCQNVGFRLVLQVE